MIFTALKVQNLQSTIQIHSEGENCV